MAMSSFTIEMLQNSSFIPRHRNRGFGWTSRRQT